MRRKYNEFYIGLIVSITIIVVIACILLLEKNNFLESGISLNLVVQDAKGIKAGGSVLYQGLDVGSVQDTKLTPKGVLLKLELTKVDSVPDDSRFLITSTSIVGNQSVEIMPGKSKTYLKDGEYITGQSSAGLSDLLKGGSQITDNANEVIKNIDTLTGNETKSKIIEVLNNMDESVRLIHRTIRSNLNNINTAINNMKKITADNKAPIDSIISRLSQHSKKLSEAMDNTERITNNVDEIMKSVNSGNGTVGKLLMSDELYNKINTAVTDLDGLIKDIKTNPGRYVHVSVF
jgi:phospholipid/cholesterol/gamma-HCH transport system substrate-binding protein